MRILLFLELFSFVFLCKAVFRRYSFFPLLVSAICNATRVFQVYPRSFSFYGALFLFRPIFAFLSVFSSPSDVLPVLFAVLADAARLSRFYGLSRAILQSLRRLAPFLFIFGVSPQFCAFFRSPAFIRPFHRINPSFTRISTLFLHTVASFTICCAFTVHRSFSCVFLLSQPFSIRLPQKDSLYTFSRTTLSDSPLSFRQRKKLSHPFSFTDGALRIKKDGDLSPPLILPYSEPFRPFPKKDTTLAAFCAYFARFAPL